MLRITNARGNSNNKNSKIFTCQHKGVEFACVVGNILTSETDAITAICDSRFTLNAGLAKTIKDVVGNDLIKNLQQARAQQNSTAIAVHVNNLLTIKYIILAPVRVIDRNTLDRAYLAIIDKAKQLHITSLTLPLLGTGQLGLDFKKAANFLKTALAQITDFGDLQKLNFIDQDLNTMSALETFLTNEVVNPTQNQGNGVQNQPSRSHNKFHPYSSNGATTSSNTGAGSSTAHTQQSTSSHDSDSSSSLPSGSRNLSLSPVLSISTVGSNNLLNQSDVTTGDGNHANDEQGQGDVVMDSDSSVWSSSNSGSDDDSDNDSDDDDSDLEDSDEDFGFSDSSMDVTINLSTDTGNGNNTNLDSIIEKMAAEAEEKTFWSVVEIGKMNKAGKGLSTSNAANTSGAPLDETTIPCSICLTDMREEMEETDAIVSLTLCSHQFHLLCIRAAFKVKKQCPLCMCWYGSPIGVQPVNATMEVRQTPGKVPGHPDAIGFHEIVYHIPNGVQSNDHIRPGQEYRGTTRVAYLPNNKVLKLLQLAFKRRLIFTIGDSVTTGRKNVPVWNGIHHKTNRDGGAQSYGYPDPGYLQRVKEELAAVGVRVDQLTS